MSSLLNEQQVKSQKTVAENQQSDQHSKLQKNVAEKENETQKDSQNINKFANSLQQNEEISSQTKQNLNAQKDKKGSQLNIQENSKQVSLPKIAKSTVQEQQSRLDTADKNGNSSIILNSQGGKKNLESPYNIYNTSLPYSRKSEPRMDYSQSQSQGSLYQAKQGHKSIAEKLNILANRINKLSKEECQLKKKADDIQENADRIYEIKRRAQIKKEEMLKKKIEVEEIPFTHPVGQIEMAKIKLSKEFIINKHKAQARFYKERLFKDTQKMMLQQQLYENEVKFKASQVKLQEQNSKNRQSAFQQGRIAEVQNENMTSLEQEQRLKDQKEEILKQLEKIEAEQLSSLNHTKQRTREAQSQLDFLKSNHPKDYEEKFGTSPTRPKETKTIKGHPASKFQNQAILYHLQEDKQGNTHIVSEQNQF